MDAKTYFSELNSAAQKVFENTAKDLPFLGSVHDCSISLQEWTEVLKHEPSIHLLKHSYEQIEISGFSILTGLYRQGFVALRLSLEMLFGGVYFSSNKVEFIEWGRSERDLSWSIISGSRSEDENEPQKGVLSHRFINAFFPELLKYMGEYQKKSKNLYRELSGFVHGSNVTWNLSSPALTFDEHILLNYKSCLNDFKNIAQFILCVRFLHELSSENKNRLDTQINDELKHIEEIRVILGGPISG